MGDRKQNGIWFSEYNEVYQGVKCHEEVVLILGNLCKILIRFKHKQRDFEIC